MIVIWRGWGPLALIAAILPVVCFVMFEEQKPEWAFILATTASCLVGAVPCVYFGSRWNRLANEHSFYEIPLEVYGWIYWGIAAFLTLITSLGGFVRLLGPRVDKVALPMGVAGVVSLLAVIVVGVFLRRTSPPSERRIEEEADERE